MKVIAFHLPQYHSIPENDAWWGKGFTDWTNVRKAKPLYKGHVQPIEPLDGNYYDMLDIETFRMQADLAKEYGVYGFCYYHYWFNGKLLLEKPCENLLAHSEIDINYCFCWANESWARTWDGKETELLIQQVYAGEKDWEAHIRYFLPFFQDKRYIKVNNKPMIFIYSCARIDCVKEMLAYWNRFVQEYGFEGLYVVESVNSFNNGKTDVGSDAVTEFEPHCAARYSVSNLCKAKRVICKKLGITDFLSYDYLWKRILNNREDYCGKKIIRGAFVGFDNSPRKGKKGMIIYGATPEKFEKNLKSLLNDKRRNYDDEFVAINAWNEWAEGAVLEPTKRDGSAYLEAVRNALKESGR